jgi:hypothetical protein
MSALNRPITRPNVAGGATELHDLNPPEQSPQPQYEPTEQLPNQVAPNTRPTNRQVMAIICAWVAFLIFSILYSAYIVWVLLLGHARIGPTTFDATTSNLLVSIFSQVSVLLADTLIRDLLDILRLALARWEGGISGLTYFTIGPASSWLSSVKHSILTKSFLKWYPLVDFRYFTTCRLVVIEADQNVRIVLPIMGLALGSVLKCKNTANF